MADAANARKRLTQAEKKAATRSELLRTAADVFARRGYHRASIEEVAEQAGFSHGAVYSNFSGKEDLFLAVFEDYMATRAGELAEALLGAPESLPKRARAIAAQWMERFAHDPNSFLLHVEFMIHAARDPDLSKKMGLRQASLRLAIQDYLQNAQREEAIEFALPPAELALIMRSLGIGLAIEALNSPDDMREDLFADFTELVFARLAGPNQAGIARGKTTET
ncbi:MAG: TetR/AcrR family transcriptional regulator [Solirubrobacteraceae bacterium]|jgi:AcrR family transcriptional regulator